MGQAGALRRTAAHGLTDVEGRDLASPDAFIVEARWPGLAPGDRGGGTGETGESKSIDAV